MSVPGFANYLSLYEDSNFSPSLPAFVASRPSVTKIEDCFDLNRLLALFRHRAVVLVGEAEERIRHESFASSSLYLVAAARAHCYYFLMSTFHDTITVCLFLSFLFFFFFCFYWLIFFFSTSELQSGASTWRNS